MDQSKAVLKDIHQVSDERTIEGVMLLVGTMKEQLDSLERFVRRRFDEISMEINATSQQLDMAEEGLTGRFGEILNALAAINFRGDGHTAANTGVELEAVIRTTEDAATQIMDAAERISTRIKEDSSLTGEQARQRFFEETRGDVESILLACSFQDLTGQRIRKISESIETIEEHISTTLGSLGIDIKADAQQGGIRDSTENHASSQADIDALFD